MRSPRSHLLLLFYWTLLALLPGGALHAQMSMEQINRGVWQHVFAVPQAQLEDPAWLARDDDGDGLSNGAEVAAGTDPFSAGSAIQITSLNVDASGAHLSFGTMKGKQYQLQKKGNLADATWKPVVPAVVVMGNNATRTVTTAHVPNSFYRVVVQDIDSDGDGSSDWAEINLGLDPQNSRSNNQVDQYGRPLTDSEYTATQLIQENVVNIATERSGSSTGQPMAGAAAEDPAIFVVSRSGLPEFLKVLTVQVAVGGTAVAGADYTPLAATVTLPKGIRSVRVPVVPLANSSRTAPGTVTMTLNAGVGYKLGSSLTSAVLIYPKSTPSGTGLTAAYYSGYNSTYTSAVNFAGSPTIRTDANVDFKWASVDPAPAGYTLPPGLAVSSSPFNVRWTGQVQPQYTEMYWFVTDVDDGAVLKLNPTTTNNQVTGPGIGQVLINGWSSRTSVNKLTSIPVQLQAGVRYNIQLDYYSKGGGEVHLSWYSNSQVKQVIPQARLYPTFAGENAAPPTLTSESTIHSYLGQPFTATLTASNSATDFSVQFGALPSGVTLTSAGVLSGTSLVAGEFPLTVRISNGIGSSDTTVTLVVLDTGNGVTREVWRGLSADASIASIPVNTAPAITDSLTSLEDNDKSLGNNYGERLRGYVTVTNSGNYYFWVSSNDTAELWISNDKERVSQIKRASLASGGSTPRQWSQQLTQKSPWINLVAGRKYYLEVLHKGRIGSSHNLAVGWMRDETGNSASLANNTGVIPGFALWKYYDTSAYANDGSAAGSLYYTKLGPQGLSVTNGSGLATLRLSDDHLHATLAYNYNGLSSEVIAKHLHADAYQNKPAGPIIFDIDSATPQADGSYVWDLAPVGVFTVADLQQIVLQGKCYLNVHTVNYPAGEVRGNFSLANGAQTFVPPSAPPALPGSAPTVAEASRFLTQSTYGPTATDLAAVTTGGYRAWLDKQFKTPSTKHSSLVIRQPNAGAPWPETLTMNAWWQRSITAPDQLRQRMAFALSQILVVSEVGPLDNRSDALSDYYDLLLDSSFGNFRDLLKNVTLHPAMGIYLDMRANLKGDLASGRHANENYAREIMQLFSIGLNRLWPDGSVVLDSSFGLVPTYDQEVINGVAQVFTGWTYGQARQANGRLSTNFSPGSAYRTPMMLVPNAHDLSEKRILNNVVLPVPASVPNDYLTTATTYVDPTYNENAYDSNGLRELDAVIDALFNHPNVGPVICRQLIQRLVTSQPSAGYVYRVVQAFNGERNVDGVATGVRGDLQETLRAILLDYEARKTPAATETIFGKQREPLLRVTAVARYLAAGPARAADYVETGTGDTSLLGRVKVTLPVSNPLPLAVGDVLNLQFGTPYNTGATAPYSSNVTTPTYSVQATYPAGASSVQAFAVDALGKARAAYTQAGTTATVTLTNHALKVGGSVDLKFAAAGGAAAEEGVFAVARVATDKNSFTVERASAATVLAGDKGVALLHRFANTGMNVNGSEIKLYTLIPHRLTVGDKVTVAANGGLDGSVVSTVATVPDVTTFTVSNLIAPATPVAGQSTGGIVVFPLVGMELERSGIVVLSTSTWNMGKTDGDSTSSSVTQSPLRSPTVFNYFFPDYKAPGPIAEKGITTPEFQLTSEANTMALTNFLTRSLYNGRTSNYPDGRASFREGGESIMMDLSPLIAFATANGVPALIDKLNLEMMGGLMSADMRQTIAAYTVPANFTAGANLTRDMVRAVVHLVITSPEYAIQK